jgi:hypothetical protein
MSCPGAISKNEVNRMYYKNFDQHITWKHGIVIEGWPIYRSGASKVWMLIYPKFVVAEWPKAILRG